MTTARRESWPAWLTTWRGEEFEGHETRITKHESRPLRPFGSPWSRKGRTTKKTAARTRRACRPVTASLRSFARRGAAILWPGHCLPVHYCSPLFSIVQSFFRGGGCSGASVQAPFAVLGGLHDERRWQQLRLPSVLVPLRPTPNDPMLRKGNVLYCLDRAFDKRAPAGSRGLRSESCAVWSDCASSPERKFHAPR